MSDIETAKTTEQMGLDEQDLRRLLNMCDVCGKAGIAD